MKLIVELWPDADAKEVHRQLSLLPGVGESHLREVTRKIEIQASGQALEAIKGHAGVRQVGAAPLLEPKNTHVRHNIGVDQASVISQGLSGSGVTVGIWDEGHVSAKHPSLANRVSTDVKSEKLHAPKVNGHATHVAGTIAAEGSYTRLGGLSLNGNRHPLERELPAVRLGAVPSGQMKPLGSGSGASFSGTLTISLRLPS